MIIKECIDSDEIRATFNIMKQLRSKLADEKNYLELVQRLQKTEGYKLVALFEDGNKCLVVAGFRIKHSLFSNGKPEMYIYDFVTDIASRSRGLGKEMFVWLKTECKKLGCTSITLDSGVQRIEAHKFYYREDMKLTSLHFAWFSSNE